MRDIETELLNEIQEIMRQSGKTQTDFANYLGVSRQSVNPYFNGRRGLITARGSELLNYLGVRIRLEPIESNDTK